MLSLVDAVDAFFDAIWSRWHFTAPLIDVIGLEQRTFLARGVALLWELCADALLALPLLGYEERSPAEELKLARQLLARLAARPTPLGAVRPLAAFAVSLAGACSVARLVQGSIRLAWHLPLFGKLCGAIVLVSLCVLLVPRAVVRTLEHASELSAQKPRTRVRAVTLGLPGAALLLPLLPAAVAAAPLLSFFR